MGVREELGRKKILQCVVLRVDGSKSMLISNSRPTMGCEQLTSRGKDEER